MTNRYRKVRSQATRASGTTGSHQRRTTSTIDDEVTA